MDHNFNITNDEENNDMRYQLYIICFVGCLCIIPKILNYISTNQSNMSQLCKPSKNNILTEVLYTDQPSTGTPVSPETCAICIENFISGEKIIGLECNHIFHSNCILEWFEKSKSCPTCRITIQ